MRELLPLVTESTEAEVDFFVGQAVSGHGCFRSYLLRIKKTESAVCPCGSGDEETPAHVFEVCKRFANNRLRKLEVGDAAICSYMSYVVRKLWVEENGPRSILKKN